MNPPSVDIKDMLESYFGSSSSEEIELYPIFIGKEPALPVNCISLFDTVGWAPQLNYDRDEKYERPSLQVRVTSVSYEQGWEIVNAIKDKLHGRAHETWNGVFYALIKCVNGPAMMDFDKNQRVRFICNFDIQRR